MRLGMDAQAAINAPRFHHQWLPDQIFIEEDFPESTEKALEARGFAVKRRGHIGLVNAFGIDAKTGERLGAADPRDKGAALGYRRKKFTPKSIEATAKTLQSLLPTYLFLP